MRGCGGLVVIVCLLFQNVGITQSDTLYVGGRYDDESLKLRWSSPELDILGIGFREGYNVQLDLIDGGAVAETLSFEIRPLSDEEILSRCRSEGDSLAFYLYRQTRDGTANLQSNEEMQWQRVMLLFGIQDNFELAKAMGMAWETDEVRVPLSYRARIQLNHSRDARLIRQVPLLTYRTITQLQAPLPPKCNCKDNQLSITGDVRSVAEQYSSYHIYRRQDSLSTWERRTPYPLITNYEDSTALLFHLDSIGTEGYYQYALQGKDMWDELGPFSEPEFVLPCHIIYAPPRLNAEEAPDRGRSLLDWSIPDSLLPLLEGFDVYRSSDRFDGYQRLNDDPLPASTFDYIDDEPLANNFYYVVARYHRGIQSHSMTRLVALIDTRPPGIPQNLRVNFDTTTFISIIDWDEVTDDDLKGYRIFFSPRPEGDKFLLYNLELEDNFYIDTMDRETLYEERTYWVTSRDYHQNESYFSDSVTISLPDRFPPVPARITGVTSDYSHVDVQWERSPSDDVARHALEWQANGAGGWQTADLVPDAYSKIYRDSNYTDGDTLLYRIAVTDSSGQTTYSNLRRGWLLAPIYLPDVDFLNGEIRDSMLRITLDYREDLQLQRLHVMGGTTPSSMRTLTYLYPAEHQIRSGIRKSNDPASYGLYQTDQPMPRRLPFYIKVRAIAENGRVSRFTLIQEIQP